MKLLALILAVLPSLALATGGTVPPPKPVQKVIKSNSAEATAAAQAHAESKAQAYGGYVDGSGNASVSVNTPASRLAVAPDVTSFPTAPCRVSVGVSGGWIGGAIGASGSVLDENCSIMESSRRLFDLGQKEASIQIMCLIDTARQALEATGTKCLIKAPAQAETVKP